MKNKKIVFVLLCAVIMLFSGCGKDIVCKDGTAVIKKSDIKLSFPENWSVCIGDDIYNKLYSEFSEEYSSSEELKHAYEDNGERLLLEGNSPDGGVSFLLSEANKGETGADELAKAICATSEFEFQSAGFYTESDIRDMTWSGIEGVMYTVRASEKKDEPVILEEREFCFECEELIYSLKINLYGGFESKAEKIDISRGK